MFAPPLLAFSFSLSLHRSPFVFEPLPPNLLHAPFATPQAIQLYGIFKIGEIIGKRKLVGYHVVDKEADEEAAHH